MSCCAGADPLAMRGGQDVQVDGRHVSAQHGLHPGPVWSAPRRRRRPRREAPGNGDGRRSLRSGLRGRPCRLPARRQPPRGRRLSPDAGSGSRDASRAASRRNPRRSSSTAENEILLGREAPEHRRIADPCPPCDLGNTSVQPLLGEGSSRSIAGARRRLRSASARSGVMPLPSAALACRSPRRPSRRRTRRMMTAPTATRTAPRRTRASSRRQRPSVYRWRSILEIPDSDALAVFAARVESIASPSAPPICCDVLKSPDARPASSSSTFVLATSVRGTKVRPSPTDITTSPGRGSEVGAIRRNQRQEAETRCCHDQSGDEDGLHTDAADQLGGQARSGTIPAVTGRKASPA